MEDLALCLEAWGQRGPSMPGSRFPRYHRHQDTVNTGHCHARPGCTQPINTLFVIWNPEFISQVRSIKIIDVRSKRQLFFVFRLSALVCAGPGETGERSCYSRGKVRYQRESGGRMEGGGVRKWLIWSYTFMLNGQDIGSLMRRRWLPWRGRWHNVTMSQMSDAHTRQSLVLQATDDHPVRRLGIMLRCFPSSDGQRT